MVVSHFVNVSFFSFLVDSSCNYPCICKCAETEMSTPTLLSPSKNLMFNELVKELQPVLSKLQKELKVNKTKLSLQIRKRTSAYDNRK